MLGRGLESLIPSNNNGGNAYPIKPSAPVPHTGNAPFPMRPLIPHNQNEMVREPSKPIAQRKEEKTHESAESVFQIEIEKIQPNPYQPRKEFNVQELKELSDSIHEFGIIQPLTVAKVIKETDRGTEVSYQLIAGERRLRAAKLAGLPRVPAIIRKIDAARTKLEMALIENIQRSNLNPIESAKAYAQLQGEFGLTQREIAIRVGKSREAVANAMRLLNLPSEIQNALLAGYLSESQGRTLLGIADPEEQKRIFLSLLGKKTTIREMQEKIKKPKTHIRVNPEYSFWQKKLEERLSAPIAIKSQGKGGEIAIRFYSEEELAGIMERLVGRGEF